MVMRLRTVMTAHKGLVFACAHLLKIKNDEEWRFNVIAFLFAELFKILVYAN